MPLQGAIQTQELMESKQSEYEWKTGVGNRSAREKIESKVTSYASQILKFLAVLGWWYLTDPGTTTYLSHWSNLDMPAGPKILGVLSTEPVVLV